MLDINNSNNPIFSISTITNNNTLLFEQKKYFVYIDPFGDSMQQVNELKKFGEAIIIFSEWPLPDVYEAPLKTKEEWQQEYPNLFICEKNKGDNLIQELEDLYQIKIFLSQLISLIMQEQLNSPGIFAYIFPRNSSQPILIPPH